MHVRTAIAAYVRAIILVVLLLATEGVLKAADCTAVALSGGPVSILVLEGCPATFAVQATGDGPLFFQWWRNNDPVAGATNATFTIPNARMADNGAAFHVTVTNSCSGATSGEAILYISLDVVPPQLLRARGDESLRRVIVTFSVAACGLPALDPLTAEEPSNYSADGGLSISNAVLDATGTNVVLTTTAQSPGTIYTLHVEGVADRKQNQIFPTDTEFQAWVPAPGADPAAVTPPPLAVSRSAATVQIAWPQGSRLQVATSPVGPWMNVVNASHPYVVTNTTGARFYRSLFAP